MRPYIEKSGRTGISGYWTVAGSMGTVEGTLDDVARIRQTGDEACSETSAVYDTFELRSVTEASPEGVHVRKDTYRNTSGETQVLRRAAARFALPGGEYEYYTQLNSWQFESSGVWEPLQAKAAVWNRGIRGTESATPMLALWNRQNGRGIVIHVFASCAWKITVSLEEDSGTEELAVIEAGVNEKDLNMQVAPGETVRLPGIVWYEFADKRDMDSAKLHAWFNREYPRRSCPVIFNTWMMTFDWLDTDKVIGEARLAASLGAEYFVIDAGWFGGEGRWYENIGNWVENTKGGFGGRMKEVSDAVRAAGMKFGLWLEPERALQGVAVTKEHPEWFFSNGRIFLTDFTNAEAREYMTKTVLDLIDRYNIGFIKFDFNEGISYDPSGAAFLRWHEGHGAFLRAIREARPEVYLGNCAGGGQRMDLYTLTLYDSVWSSDNQGIYDGTRIFKDSFLRLPPGGLEKWLTLHEAAGFMQHGFEGLTRRMLSASDATWENIIGTNWSYIEAFTAGGPLGLSFELRNLSEEAQERLRAVIAQFKKDREIWLNAEASILCDTPQVLALQFVNRGTGRAAVAVYTLRHRQKTLTLYPKLPAGTAWVREDDGTPVTEALTLPLPPFREGTVIRLKQAE